VATAAEGTPSSEVRTSRPPASRFTASTLRRAHGGVDPRGLAEIGSGPASAPITSPFQPVMILPSTAGGQVLARGAGRR
jgi:hypothetical protein